MLNELCKMLNRDGIGYHKVKLENGYECVYIDHGAFGHPAGMKIRRNEFRPDFRISVHDGHTKYYTKVCGATEYLSYDDILRTIENWG